jgi:hypothetical protein
MSRRNLLAGLGIAAGGSVLLANNRAEASAPVLTGPDRSPDTTPPGLVSLSSAPELGVGYRFAYWADFSPEIALSEGRTWSGGVYTTNDYLAASFDLPPGVLLHDVEWYTDNAADASAHTSVWMSGQEEFPVNMLEQTIAANGALHATRNVVPQAVNGPYPHGSRLRCAFFSSGSGQRVHGVRVGFLNAPRATVLRSAALRVYDSRSHSPIGSSQSRRVSVDGHVAVGAAGALLSVTALNTYGHGELTVGSSVASATTRAAVWSRAGDTTLTQVTTTLSATRTFVVTGHTNSTDVIIDLLGYLV